MAPRKKTIEEKTVRLSTNILPETVKKIDNLIDPRDGNRNSRGKIINIAIMAFEK
jgi:hypothetical protein